MKLPWIIYNAVKWLGNQREQLTEFYIYGATLTNPGDITKNFLNMLNRIRGKRIQDMLHFSAYSDRAGSWLIKVSCRCDKITQLQPKTCQIPQLTPLGATLGLHNSQWVNGELGELRELRELKCRDRACIPGGDRICWGKNRGICAANGHYGLRFVIIG